MTLCHLTIGRLDEILALAKIVQRDWNSMSNYLRLAEYDSCPERHELGGCHEYHELDHIVKGLGLDALDELVALCLLGDPTLEPGSFRDLLHHVQGSPPNSGEPTAELFAMGEMFNSLSRGLARLGTRGDREA